MAKFKPVAHDADFVRRVMKKPGVKIVYDALSEEYALLRELLHARQKAGLTQNEVAQRMGTQRPAVTRIETSLANGKHSPSLSTLRKYAVAVGCRLEVRLAPEKNRSTRSELDAKKKNKALQDQGMGKEMSFYWDLCENADFSGYISSFPQSRLFFSAQPNTSDDRPPHASKDSLKAHCLHGYTGWAGLNPVNTFIHCAFILYCSFALLYRFME